MAVNNNCISQAYAIQIKFNPNHYHLCWFKQLCQWMTIWLVDYRLLDNHDTLSAVLSFFLVYWKD